jgi:hypothetical protein
MTQVLTTELGTIQGGRSTGAPEYDWRIEIAVWAPSAQGLGPGYYACFRIFIEDGIATTAVLFCFYDGNESSPNLSTLQDAQALHR